MTTKIPPSLLDAGTLSMVREANAVINGDFNINQRAVNGTVTLSSGDYGHDRWKAGSGGCTYTFASSNGVTTLTITAGSLKQVIEGANVPHGSVVLSWTGTAQGKIDSGSYSASGVTGTGTGGTNLTIEFNTGTLTKVQLEAGTVATTFQRRSRTTELGLCQRYYFAVTGYPLGVTLNVSDGYSSVLRFPVSMRAAPTLVAGATYTVGSGSAGTPELSTVTVDAALMRNSAANWSSDVALSMTGAFTAEL